MARVRESDGLKSELPLGLAAAGIARMIAWCRFKLAPP